MLTSPTTAHSSVGPSKSAERSLQASRKARRMRAPCGGGRVEDIQEHQTKLSIKLFFSVSQLKYSLARTI